MHADNMFVQGHTMHCPKVSKFQTGFYHFLPGRLRELSYGRQVSSEDAQRIVMMFGGGGGIRLPIS